MTTAPAGERNVHLVGTVPLPDTRSVFRQVGAPLKHVLPRIPDGETGIRHYWISSQARLLHEHPAFEPVGHNWTPGADMPADQAPKYRLRSGVDPAGVELPSFGYARYAAQSYREFLRARSEGVLAPRTKFQVCLPTPVAFFCGIVHADSSEALAPAFDAAISTELREIVAAIPADDLAIQWDVCLEIFVWEGIRTVFFRSPREEIIARLVRLGEQVPEPVELGYHLCYGDFRHKHGVEPRDMGNMVTIGNAVAAGLGRPIDFMHMPVPRDRDDEAYFAPLRELSLGPRAELYLGLVHHTDGEAGTRRRMTAADRVLTQYGISTECGWGRRDPATIGDLVRIHAACARENSVVARASA